MKKSTKWILAIFIFLQFHVTVHGEEVDNREIIVQTEETSHLISSGLVPVETSSILSEHDIYVFEIPGNLDYEKVLHSLEQDPTILSIESNTVRQIESHSLSNEPYYHQQWYLPAIKLPELLRHHQDTDNAVTVAVLDTGVNPHPELAGRTLPGYNFVDNHANPVDQHGHGTFIAGILAANIDGEGIAGMAEHIAILPVKIGNYKGEVRTSHFLEGLYYAMEQDADIVNMSFAGSSQNQLEEQVINEAYEEGIVLVAASGNYGTESPKYPASYPKVISVGAVRDTGQQLVRTYFSSNGTTLDVTAPGQGILSLGKEEGYLTGDGTSFAAPMVSGLAAYLKSVYPTWSPSMIKWAIEKGALLGDYSSGHWNKYTGYGVIDMEQTMQLSPPDMTQDISNDRQTSFPIDAENVTQEQLELPFDDDWYEWELAEESQVVLQLVTDDPSLELRGELYKENDREPLLSLTGNTPVEISLEEGVYQIKVYDRLGRWSNLPYELEIKEIEREIHFVDLNENHTHYDGIYDLVGRGAIEGYPLENGLRAFRPKESISREHVAKILTYTLDLPIPEDVSGVLENFSDINDDHLYAKEIAAMYKAEIFQGMNNQFIEGPISREQMASVLVRTFSLSDTHEKVDINLKPVSRSHRDSVKILKQHGVTTERDYRPHENVTRGQFASFVYRAMGATE